MRSRNLTLLTTALLLAMACTAQAQTTQTVKPEDDRPPVLKQYVYNVSELIRVAEDYPLQPAMIPSTRLPVPDDRGMHGGGGRGMMASGGPGMEAPEAGSKPVKPATTMDALAELIRDSIDPASWAENGGLAAMRPFGRSLIISQSEENHRAIKTLLEQLQKEAVPSRMVSVRAYWLLLEATDLPAMGAAAKSAKKPTAMLEVPDEMMNEKNIYSQGQTLCFNGQTVHISSGRGHTIVTGATPVVGQSSVGYDYTTAVVQNGVALQVKPDVTPDGKSAVLDLQSIVSELPEMKDVAAKQPTTNQSVSDASAAVRSEIDRVNVVAQQFRTTVRIPLDKKILIGGMTMEPNNAANSSRNLYLVVEVSASD